MDKIGLLFGPGGGNTEKVAKKIAKELGENNVEIIPVKSVDEKSIEKFDKIIFGVSTIGKHTWDADHVNNDWDFFFPKLNKIDLSGKTIAIFGLGDHITYDLHFCDAIGLLGDKVIERGGRLIGFVSVDDYEFRESFAVRDGQFIGLPIDEDYESNLTDERIKKWINKIKQELGL
ncbi:MAG: flavodoxin [Bacteroidales bacterium]|nr:flavodoxin [Bacteroidales bacterium]